MFVCEGHVFVRVWDVELLSGRGLEDEIKACNIGAGG